jgi:hypothetical protein
MSPAAEGGDGEGEAWSKRGVVELTDGGGDDGPAAAVRSVGADTRPRKRGGGRQGTRARARGGGQEGKKRGVRR